MSQKELIELGRSFLEHAPEAVPAKVPDLLGFTGPVGFVCERCAGRIVARGCSLNRLATASAPVCDLCAVSD